MMFAFGLMIANFTALAMEVEKGRLFRPHHIKV